MHNAEIQVVAGIIQDAGGHILLAKRHKHQHQGGLWEFPGGKKEAKENAQVALARELEEELGIEVKNAHPAISISHHYPDKQILLDVWWVTDWQGLPYGREGQSVRWVNPNALDSYAFPEANKPILQALRLPAKYVISPAEPEDLDSLLQQLTRQLQRGLKLYQLRLADVRLYRSYVPAVFRLCQQYHCQLLLNSRALTVLSHLPVGVGVHYRTADMLALKQRPDNLPLCAASCHNTEEIQQAQRVGVDFITLSPVKATLSHPEATPLGWQQFWQLSRLANCPVYALGGMSDEDLACARAHGAQGVAGIRGLGL